MRDEEKMLAEAIEKFPAEFGLRAFPGRRFRLSRSASFVNDAGKPMLYTEVLGEGEGEWLAFAKGTESELRGQIVSL